MKRILLVDDEPDFRASMAALLSSEGYVVAEAGNGVAALALARAGAFDLVITDLIMPEKEGLETIVALRKVLPSMKIIAMSGSGATVPNNYLDIAGALGAQRTLEKPFSGRDLLAAVRAVSEV